MRFVDIVGKYLNFFILIYEGHKQNIMFITCYVLEMCQTKKIENHTRTETVTLPHRIRISVII